MNLTKLDHSITTHQLLSHVNLLIHGLDTEKIYQSPCPNKKLPETSCWNFLFKNETILADDRVVYVDGSNNEELKYVLHLMALIFYLFMKSQVQQTKAFH